MPTARRSSRKQAAALRLSDRVIGRILFRHLEIHPYKIVIAQELSERDFGTPITLCQDLIRSVHSTDGLMFSDETRFHFSDTVNKQNFRYRNDTKRWQLHEWPLHSPKVNVVCVFNFGALGPFFFVFFFKKMVSLLQ